MNETNETGEPRARVPAGLRLAVAAMVALTIGGAAASCLGGPSAGARQRSHALGNQAQGVPLDAVHHGDWRAAATGHGAVDVPREVIVAMERESRPGGHFRGQLPEQGPAANAQASAQSSGGSAEPTTTEVTAPAAQSNPPETSAPPARVGGGPARRRQH